MTETLPVRQALSALLSRCSHCGQRRPYEGRRWCKPCILKWQRSSERTGQQYRGLILDPSASLESIVPPHYAKAELCDLPKSLVETYLALPDERGLYLWGEPGRGKTHSMCAFAKHLWSTGWDISRISYELLALQIRDSYKPGSSTSELDVIQPLLTAGKLIIEDVGTTVSAGQQETEFSLRTFLVLLDRRLEQSLATFVTSNKSVEELARSFDQRIASRIRQGCEVIQIWGRDKRSENG